MVNLKKGLSMQVGATIDKDWLKESKLDKKLVIDIEKKLIFDTICP